MQLSVPVICILAGLLAIIAGASGKIVWLDGMHKGEVRGLYPRLFVIAFGVFLAVISVLQYWFPPSSGDVSNLKNQIAEKDQTIKSLQQERNEAEAKYEEIKSDQRFKQKFVALLDSNEKARVYNPDVFDAGGTNADEISLVLSAAHLPPDIVFVKESLTETWILNRAGELNELDPDLIVVHGSGFSGDGDGTDRNGTFIPFVKSVSDRQTPMIVYSRALGESSTKISFCRALKGQTNYDLTRIFPLNVECENAGYAVCSFQVTRNIIQLREYVNLLLDDDEQTNPENSCQNYSDM